MGICASCLGLNRHKNHDPSESARLLYDDPYQAGYGAFQQGQPHNAYQPDPQYLKREREALDSITQRTSDTVVDIWAPQPQQHALASGDRGGAKAQHYQKLVKHVQVAEDPTNKIRDNSGETPSVNGMDGKMKEADKDWVHVRSGSQSPELWSGLTVDFT